MSLRGHDQNGDHGERYRMSEDLEAAEASG